MSLKKIFPGAAALSTLVLVLFLPTLKPLIEYWTENPDYSHCFIVPFVSLYFLYKKFSELEPHQIQPWYPGFAALFLSLSLFLTAQLGGIAVAQRVSFILVIHGLVAFNLGWTAYKKLWFPLYFLFLMIPLPITLHGMISFPLQVFATKASAEWLRYIGVPVYKVGNILHFQEGALEVVEACSGIRSLLSFFTLSIFFAYVDQKGWIRRIALVLMAIPIALFANITRVTLSGIIGHVYGMRFARGFMHDFSGFALFFFGLLIMFIISHILKNATKGEAT